MSYTREYLSDKIDDKIHLSVPSSLRQALVAIETVFSESLTEGLAELRTGIASLKKYLNSRKSESTKSTIGIRKSNGN